MDPQTRIARSNGGALLGELDIAAQAHGLVCPTGVVGHTGVAGLTLGGGVGRLQRHFGLTIDNLTAVELVDRRRPARPRDRDRRARALLGPARRRLELRDRDRLRVPAPAVRARPPPRRPGVPGDPGPGRLDRLPRLRADRARCGVGASSASIGPDRTPATRTTSSASRSSYLAWNHSGSAEDVERDTAGLRVGPTPVTTTIASVPYLDVQTAHDLAFAWGSRSFIKSHNANDVRREALDELVELVATAPGEGTFSVTALGRRDRPRARGRDGLRRPSVAFDLSADASWTDPARDEANADWCRRAMAVVEPDRALGAYANGNADAGPEESRRIYGDAKLARLAALKREWDPDNVFHVNPNVAPAAG